MMNALLHCLENHARAGMMQCAVLLGTTLAALAAITTPAAATNTKICAYKDLKICVIDKYTWRYYGTLSVENTGNTYPTNGLKVEDCINYYDACKYPVPPANFTPNPNGSVIQPGKTSYFKYSIDEKPLDPSNLIKNKAKVSISNPVGDIPYYCTHPKAAWPKDEYPPLCRPIGCTRTIGYWKTHADAWPVPWQNKTFYLSAATWLSALHGGPTQNNGYWILARAYIGAVLNRQANGGISPVDAQILLAKAFFEVFKPSYCDGAGSCGVQKALAGVLQNYNEGKYPGIPHCN